MIRVHIHLKAADLNASREFYEKLFGVSPAKLKPDQLKFLPALAPRISPSHQPDVVSVSADSSTILGSKLNQARPSKSTCAASKALDSRRENNWV
jgi:hypothetical protein